MKKMIRHVFLTSTPRPYSASQIAKHLEARGVRDKDWVLLDLAPEFGLRAGETPVNILLAATQFTARFQVAPSWGTPRTTALVELDAQLAEDPDLAQLMVNARLAGLQIVFLAKTFAQISTLPNRVIDEIGLQLDHHEMDLEAGVPMEICGL